MLRILALGKSKTILHQDCPRLVPLFCKIGSMADCGPIILEASLEMGPADEHPVEQQRYTTMMSILPKTRLPMHTNAASSEAATTPTPHPSANSPHPKKSFPNRPSHG
ncbi:hypothetical protein XPA_009702 [Xanthoria parietina]